VQTYTKTLKLSGSDSIIWRFLPKEFGRLLFFFLACVKGAEAKFALELYNNQEACDVTNTFLFAKCGKLMSAESIRITVSGTLSRAFGQENCSFLPTTVLRPPKKPLQREIQREADTKRG